LVREKLAAWPWSRLTTGAVVVYWAALVLGTHLPGSAVPSTPCSDKTLHFWAYAGLAFLLAWSWTTRRTFLWGGAAIALFLASGYGGLDELTQTFVPGRCADVVDWCYDTAGAICGVATFFVLQLGSRKVLR
jgi:VanZ family protein